MTGARRAFLLLALVALGGCERAQGVVDTKDALEGAGYRAVEVSLRTGAGIGVARVEAAEGGPAPERAAEVAWRTVPVRFDQLVVVVGSRSESFGYGDLAARFGPRDPSLDRRQIDDEVVRDGLELMLLLSIGALLSVAAVVALGLAVLRTARRVTGQAEGPASGLGEGAATPGAASETADGEDAIPS